jgi:GNAT superfamily N-acetyltransferase
VKISYIFTFSERRGRKRFSAYPAKCDFDTPASENRTSIPDIDTFFEPVALDDIIRSMDTGKGEFGGMERRSEIKSGPEIEHLTTLSGADQSAIRELIEVHQREFGSPHDEELEQDLKHLGDYTEKGSAIFVVREEGKIIGSLFMRPGENNAAEIRHFQVANGHEEKGREMLEDAIRFAQESGFEKIALGAYASEKKAIDVFHHVGFRETKRDEEKLFFEMNL